jgi:uncharacterized membrane protein YhfC
MPMSDFTPLFFTHPLNGLLMILIGIGWGFYLTGKFKLDWRLYWIGAVTFILSQVVHLPLNVFLTWLFQQGYLPPLDLSIRLYVNAGILGLTAGLSEESFRYIVLRWWAKDARRWRDVVLYGAGHGGVEAIILGGLVIYTFFSIFSIRGIDLATLYTGSELALAEQQVNLYWSLAWYEPLVGALERLLTIPVHIAMALMVAQVFIRKNILWLFAAIGWHTALNATAVIVVQSYGPYVAELAIGLFTIASIWIIVNLRNKGEIIAEAIRESVHIPDATEVLKNLAERVEDEDLDRTRYR